MARPLRSSYVCTPPRRPRIKATRGEPHASVQAISIALRIGMEETLNKKIPDARVRKKPLGGSPHWVVFVAHLWLRLYRPKGVLTSLRLSRSDKVLALGAWWSGTFLHDYAWKAW